MCKEIKFRAWDKRNNKMLQWGNLLHMHNTLTCLSFNFFEIMQYTGLQDKKRTKQYPKGQEIYEGDILKFGDFVWTVEWKNDRLGFGYSELGDRMLEDDGQNGEVIGNIYESPELLEEGKSC